MDTLGMCDRNYHLSIYALYFSTDKPLKEVMLFINIFRVRSKSGHICTEGSYVQLSDPTG